MSVITHVFAPTYWSVRFAGTPYTVKPKRLDKAGVWCKTEKANICYNLAFFNMSNGDTVNFVSSNYRDVGPTT